MDGEIVLTGSGASNDQRSGTKMESFLPLAGSIVMLGYDLLGEVAGISLEVREIVDDKGGVARGALATVKQDQYKVQNAFIDADEIPELLKGIDALIGVTSNPTKFSYFEVKYKTRGALEIVAFNNRNGLVSYTAKAGRGAVAQVFNLSRDHLRKIKSMLEAAATKITEVEQSY